jgi:hypothetical protein
MRQLLFASCRLDEIAIIKEDIRQSKVSLCGVPASGTMSTTTVADQAFFSCS